ncbi:hypothetical protein [Kitasatospora sp. NPDC059327]|uniref:hypothetical protein n=1 Tax=Kitasatospora sp. NPDC059327 TaxID=3346803 RepID=UPI0036829EF0
MPTNASLASGDGDLLVLVELLSLVSPLVLLVVVLVLTVRLLRSRRDGAPAAGCALATATAAFAASCAYVGGRLAGPGLSWITDEKWCGLHGFTAAVVERTSFPMSAHCAPGGDELVPVWVNPVLVGGTLATVLALAAGLAAHLRVRARSGARGQQS